jgi:putative DNA primase/helicase
VSGDLAAMLTAFPPQTLLPGAGDSEYADFVLGSSRGRDILRDVERGGDYIVWNGRLWEPTAGERKLESAFMTCVSAHETVARFLPDEDRGDELKRVRHRSSTRGMNAALPRVKTRMEISRSQLPRHPKLLNVENGILDLRSGKLLPHDRTLMITQQADAAWDEAARDTRWEQLLATSIPNPDVRRLVLQLLGLSLLGGRVREKKLPILYSEQPDTGKTLLLTAFGRVLGTYARAVDVKGFMESRWASGAAPNSQLAQLEGVRFAYGSEIGVGPLDEALVKRITGGDPISTRELHGKQFTYKPEFTLWLAGNEFPAINHTSEATWARVLAIPFSRPPKLDATLPDHLATAQARAAILASAVQGLRDYRDNGLQVPLCVSDYREQLREEANPLADFIETHLVRDPAGSAPVRKVRLRYEDTTSKPIGQKAFNRSMRAMGFEQGSAGRENLRVWKGLRLRDPAM